MKSKKALLLGATISVLAFAVPAVQATEVGTLETVTEFTDYRGGGVAITPEGRIFVSMFPMDSPKYRVVELMANGTKRPYPTIDWADGTETGEVGISGVIGIHSDSKGVLWILDMGSEKSPAKLVGWDSVKEQLHATIEIDKAATLGNSFLQDFVIDEVNQKIYIADMSLGNLAGETKPAIISIDIKTGKAKRILEGTSSFMPPQRDIIIDASLLASKSEDGKVTKLHLGLNPIAIDGESKWVYFGAVSGEIIYRIPASVLADDNISDEKRASKIEEFGPKRPSDGIAIAPGGGILATDVENSAVGLTTKGKYEVLVQDKQLSWPDSIAVSNGWVYVTQDQLHLLPPFSQGLGNAKPPYKLMRFRYQP